MNVAILTLFFILFCFLKLILDYSSWFPRKPAGKKTATFYGGHWLQPNFDSTADITVNYNSSTNWIITLPPQVGLYQ
jgi:hypothetical protein